MENSILARLPFDPIILIIIMGIAIVVLFVLLISTMTQLNRLIVQYKSFMKGKDGVTLEESFLDRFEEIDRVTEAYRSHEKLLARLKASQRNAYHKIGIIKYDAFQEMGAKLSFALTLLNDKNSGFILNSMHSREGCYTYIKEIVKGESFVALSEEEVQSLEQAVNSDNYMEA